MYLSLGKSQKAKLNYHSTVEQNLKKSNHAKKLFNLSKIPEQEINIYIVFSCRFHVFRLHNIYVAIKPNDLFQKL